MVRQAELAYQGADDQSACTSALMLKKRNPYLRLHFNKQLRSSVALDPCLQFFHFLTNVVADETTPGG